MSNPNEAQYDEGQKVIPEAVADITGLTEEQIGERIEKDEVFAKAYAQNKIVDKGTKAPGEEDATPVVAQTPSDPVVPAVEKEVPVSVPPQGEHVFTIKAGELPAGFDTPGKVFKSLLDKQTYIEHVHNQNRQQTQRIQELERQLEEKEKEKQEHARQVENEDIDESKLYDPEYLKEQFKALNELKRTKAELDELKSKMNQKEEKEKADEATAGEFKALNDFQQRFPAFQTKRSIAELDAEYANLVSNIAKLTGSATQQEALKYVNTFLNDKGESGETLRAAAAKSNVATPDLNELSPYLKLMTVRQKALDKQLTMEDAFKLTYTDMYVQSFAKPPKQDDPPRPPTPQEIQTREREKQRLEAAKIAAERAAEVPPGSSGTSESVDDLSDQQIDELFSLKPHQLRAEPHKIKLLNDIYRKLGQPPLNINGQRDALL